MSGELVIECQRLRPLASTGVTAQQSPAGYFIELIRGQCPAVVGKAEARPILERPPQRPPVTIAHPQSDRLRAERRVAHQPQRRLHAGLLDVARRRHTDLAVKEDHQLVVADPQPALELGDVEPLLEDLLMDLLEHRPDRPRGLGRGAGDGTERRLTEDGGVEVACQHDGIGIPVDRARIEDDVIEDISIRSSIREITKSTITLSNKDDTYTENALVTEGNIVRIGAGYKTASGDELQDRLTGEIVTVNHTYEPDKTTTLNVYDTMWPAGLPAGRVHVLKGQNIFRANFSVTDDDKKMVHQAGVWAVASSRLQQTEKTILAPVVSPIM